MSNFNPTMVQKVRAERARAQLDGFDEEGILRDGHALVVPLYAMDSSGSINPELTDVQRAVARDKAMAKAMADAAAEARATEMYTADERRLALDYGLAGPDGLHRPGPRKSFTFDSKKVQDARLEAHRAYIADLEGAWRNPTGDADLRRAPTKEEAPMPKQTFSDAEAKRFGLTDGRQLHRPGFRFAADPYAKDAAICQYADYDAAAESAWKGNPPTGFGSHGPQGAKEGDVCIVDGGGRGRMIDMGGGRLIGVEEPHASDYLREVVDDMAPTQDGLSDRDAARIEYEADLCSAWKMGRSDPEVHVDAAPAVKDAKGPVAYVAPASMRDAAAIAREHQQIMSRLYGQLDSELSEKWRNP